MKKIVIIEPIGLTISQQDIFINEMKQYNYSVESYKEVPYNEIEAINRIKNAEIVIVGTYSLTENILQEANNLKFISVAFTGVDHINLNYCKKNNIIISNSAGYSTDAVAELTIGLMIGIYRNFISNHQKCKQGLGRELFLGQELKNKTIGIIGTGAIGKKVIDLLTILGCKILAYSRTELSDLKNKVTYCSLNELLQKSDIVSLHIPLNETTKHILNQENLTKLQKHAILINTARGGLIDNQFLAKILHEKKISGAALDVYDYEPPLALDYAILNAPNTILLPHIGYATKEAIETRSEIVINNIYGFLKGEIQNIC